MNLIHTHIFILLLIDLLKDIYFLASYLFIFSFILITYLFFILLSITYFFFNLIYFLNAL